MPPAPEELYKHKHNKMKQNKGTVALFFDLIKLIAACILHRSTLRYLLNRSSSRHALEAGDQEEASLHPPRSLTPTRGWVVLIREPLVLTFLKHCFDLPGKCRKVVSKGHNHALLHIPLVRPVKR